MRIYSLQFLRVSLFIMLTGFTISCEKLVAVDGPIDAITANEMYRTEAQAEGALAGIYNAMIHGPGASFYASTAIERSFAAGLATYAGGLSAGEFHTIATNVAGYVLGTNRITLQNNNFPTNFWTAAYNVIYNANAVIEGIAGAKESIMRDSVKIQYIAEAKFLRAFTYFYLINFFGDVPLALTVDFNQTALVSRSPVAAVYAQIRKDLEEAERDLSTTYAVTPGSRVRVNKWVAKAMLAKLHLYMGNNVEAAAKATELIDQTSIYQLEPLNDVFLTGSREAIFQLMQTNQDPDMRNATSEGCFFIPLSPYASSALVWLSPELLNAFEPGDQRKENWTDSTLQTQGGGPNTKVWYPTKYKTGRHNAAFGGPSNEYYMVLRLAEMYLIRAEARANGAAGGHAKAIEDLNAIRFRTSLPNLPLTLDATAVKDAVARERAIEFFAEWGNRWMDLKRTGKASSILSVIPFKQPWEGDYQLLYPIPGREIETNSNLIQNPGYIR